jgi:hypothetical protein
VGCVARVRGLIYIDTAAEVLLMIDDDVLRRGQYDLDRHDLHALERPRLRGHDVTAMRAAIVRAGGVVAARAHVMAILVLTDWSRDIRARTLRSIRTTGA